MYFKADNGHALVSEWRRTFAPYTRPTGTSSNSNAARRLAMERPSRLSKKSFCVFDGPTATTLNPEIKAELTISGLGHKDILLGMSLFAD